MKKSLLTFKTTFIFILLYAISNYTFAQNHGINQMNPDTSAVLEVYSKEKGFLVPRLSTTEQGLIPSPATGLMLYNNTINEFVFWDGDSWEKINNKFISNTTGTGTPSNSGVSFNESGNTAHLSAELDINADGTEKKGLLLPRSIPSSIITPTAEGLLIYNTSNNKISFYNGSSWLSFCTDYSSNTVGSGTFSSKGISINTSTIDPSAIVELSSTNSGLLIPRMLPPERDNIISPIGGLMIYNTTDKSIDFYNGTEWRQLLFAPPAQPGSITGNFNVCDGNSETYSISAVSEATTYNWTVPIGTVIASGQGTASIDVTIGSSTGSICVTAENNCGTSTNMCQTITIQAAPAQPGSITGNINVCDGGTETYSITPVSGATTYNWTAPSGTIITSGQGTTSIDVTIGSSAGNICVNAENSCDISTNLCQAITIQAAPAQPGSITGNFNICEGTSETYSITSVSGATTYNWTAPSGSVITSGQGTTSIDVTIGSSAGNICVNAENSCDISTNLCQAITIQAAPAQPGSITGIFNLCPGTTNQTYSIPAVTGATTYNWTVPSGAIIVSGQGTTSINVTIGSLAGNICVNAGNSCGNSNNSCQAITIKTLSTDPTSIVSSLNPACDGDFLTLTVNGGTLGTGAGWSWSVGIIGSTCGDFFNTGNTRYINFGNNYPTIVYHVRAVGDCNTTDCVEVEVEHCP